MGNGKISFNCPGCGRTFNVDARLKGRKIRCSQCKRLSPIPSSSSKARPRTIFTTPSAKRDDDNATDSATQPEPVDEQPAPEPVTEQPVPKQPEDGKPARIRIKPAGTTSKRTPDSETPAPAPPVPKHETPEPGKTPRPDESTNINETQTTTESGHAAEKPPSESAASTKSVAAATPDAPETADMTELRGQLREAEAALAEMTTRRENEEVAYSRTIAKLSTQLDDATNERDQLADELNELREQKQRWEKDIGRQHAEAKAMLRSATDAVDEYCKTQLNGMQTLRQKLKEMA